MGAFAGPEITMDSNYVYHVCYTSGTFTPNFTGTVEVLVVGGGGGGGMDMGGGGGGGGVQTNTSYSVTAGSGITVTVGAGGSGAPAGGTPGQNTFHQFQISATGGSNSVFGSITAYGGGYGGSSYFGYSPNNGYGQNSTASGGGASAYSDGSTGRGGTGGAQGNAGGGSIGQYYGGGGGGAGGTGGSNPPNGGAGTLNRIRGYDLYWGGGGGGAGYSGYGGSGGNGGGGGGAVYKSDGIATSGGAGINPGERGGGQYTGDQINVAGGSGGRGTGGGGGGGSHYNRNNAGGNGGSGIVIIRHLRSAGTSTFNGQGDPMSSLMFSMDAANTAKGSAIELLVVGAGGGGGMDMGGGGGAGGVFLSNNYIISPNVAYPVTIGAGGAGSPGPYAGEPPAGSSGGSTSFGNLVMMGGGGGGSGHYFPVAYSRYARGVTGASGGGDSTMWGRNKPVGTIPFDPAYGSSGGSSSGYGDGYYTGGGGGGAFEAGMGGNYGVCGHGGRGVLSDIAGTSYYWGGGGGGSGWYNSGGNGGAGGGGSGANGNGTPGSAGSGYNSGSAGGNQTNSNGGAGGANTGGGGGGGTHAYSVGGNGGSGIVIARYLGSQAATGGTVTTAGSYTVHTFTSSGTFTATNDIGVTDTGPMGFKLTPSNLSRSTSNGGSYEFNGSNSYINLDVNIQSGYTSASYEFWCKPTSLPGSGAYNQLYIQEASTWIGLYNSGYVFFGIDLNNGSGWFDNNGGANTGARTTSALSANAIYCVTYSWDGSNVRVYLNGKIEATASTLQAANGRQNVTQLGPGTTSRNIGSRYSGSGNQWAGSIYSIKFYNKALSSDEVFQNFIALRGRFGI